MSEQVFSRETKRHGSTLIVVVSVLTVASLVAVASFAIGNKNRRASEMESDFLQADSYANASLEAAIAELRADPNWRTTFSGNQDSVSAYSKTFGDDSLSWYIVDQADADITNNESDPIRIYGRGEKGESQREMSVLAFPTGQPLDVLRSPLHATGQIHFYAPILSAHGPISSNELIHGHWYTIFGSLDAPTISQAVVECGKATTVSGKKFPHHSVYEAYRAIATEVDFASLPHSPQLKDVIIDNNSSPSPTTPKNINGVYLVEVPAATIFEITNCKITGTLVIKLMGANSKLDISDGVVWNPLRKDFPSLIVYTENDSGTRIDIQCKGTMTVGAETSDASLNGLFHVIRNLESPGRITFITATHPIRGSILVEGEAGMDYFCRLIADPQLMANPPIGYQTASDTGNLLNNGDFESQIAPWYPVGSTDSGGGTQIHRDTDEYSGSYSLRVSNRPGADFGVVQDVTRKLVSGEFYSGTFNAKMEDGRELLKATFEYIDDNGFHSESIVEEVAETAWTSIMVNFSPSWTGTLQSGKIVFSTASSNQDFLIDTLDLSTAGPTDVPNIAIFPSTIRLEPGN